ncbi:uncharacterized protein LOC123551753 isoform X1 [Mercenaria mercenaria]|uniref:uncharacterized protein LOC123551753 isoform X1 n=1 Tax=Mercenaria mercenaria TaxID=6596 RepID=UPI00234E46BE|nr:uncharacterized protein LOC123551753 isoform X1 [Mercenaria mercenaria]
MYIGSAYRALFIIIYSIKLQAFVQDGYIGCFKDYHSRVLDERKTDFNRNSGKRCKKFCRGHGYRYAGTETGTECFCGNEIRFKIPASNCDYKCEGKPSEFCGGDWRISIYDTGYCANGPCLNGATCVEIFTDVYRCICTDEWTGTYCENKKPKTTVNSLSTTTTKITTSTAFYKKTSTASGKSTDGSSREYRTNVTDSTYINPTDSGNNGMIAVYVLVPLIAITLAILFAVFISRKSTLKCLRTLDVEQESNQNASNYYENTKHYRQLGTERSQQSDTEYKGSRDGQRIKIESSGVTYYNTVDGTKGFEVQRNYENVKNSWMSIGGESRNKTEAHCESSSNTASLQCYESLRKDTQDKDNSYDCLKIKK